MANSTSPSFPTTRMRRVRQNDWSRRLHGETTLTVNDLIWPIFIIEGKAQTEPVASMPGVERLSIDMAVKAAHEAADLGIPALALFPSTPSENKSTGGQEAINPDNLVNRATRAIKAAVPEIGLIVDVALDPYT
ncbi:MAG: porphobilinogen synthase, partial [Sphingomonadales bacterium]|nr:porphobilinogen synthase [Sphingomonadales bacterium]